MYYFTARQLKDLRLKKGIQERRKITQSVFANDLKKSRSTIATWESDDSGVSKRDDAIMVAKYFNLDIDTIGMTVEESSASYGSIPKIKGVTQSIIDALHQVIDSKDEIIAQKERIIEEKDKRIAMLEIQLGVEQKGRKAG